MVKNLPAVQETWVWFLDLKLAFFFLIKVMYAYCFKGQIVISFNKKQAWEFPGGPVVMTWCFHYWTLGSIPGWVSKIPQVKQSGQGGGKRQILFFPHLLYVLLAIFSIVHIFLSFLQDMIHFLINILKYLYRNLKFLTTNTIVCVFFGILIVIMPLLSP